MANFTHKSVIIEMNEDTGKFSFTLNGDKYTHPSLPAAKSKIDILMSKTFTQYTVLTEQHYASDATGHDIVAEATAPGPTTRYSEDRGLKKLWLVRQTITAEKERKSRWGGPDTILLAGTKELRPGETIEDTPEAIKAWLEWAQADLNETSRHHVESKRLEEARRTLAWRRERKPINL